MSSSSVSEAKTTGYVLYTSSVAASIAIDKNTERCIFILNNFKLKYSQIDVAVSTVDKEYMHANSKAENKRLLPQIFYNGEYIGGKDEIDDANEHGELKELLKIDENSTDVFKETPKSD